MTEKKLRTSVTDPLIIAEVSVGDGGGTLGLTICPGKQGESVFGGRWQRDLNMDIAFIKNWGAHAVVTLMEQHELDRDQVSLIGAAVKASGMDWYHLPIVDVSIPDQAFSDSWVTAGVRLREQLRAGQNILIHCRGGLGRTGLIAAQLLIEMGWGTGDAIKAVRDARPGAIETPEQENYVRQQQRVSLEQDDRASRVLGCLMGGAIGDALGYQVEFDKLDAIHRKFGPSGVQLPIPGVAMVSDDTQMTLFTLEGLIRARGQNIEPMTESIWQAYLDWHLTQQGRPVDPDSITGELAFYSELQVQRAPGVTCLNALSKGTRDTTTYAVNDSKGCGTVMRVAPIGFFHENLDETETFQIGVLSSALTHGHITAQLAGGAMALLIRTLTTGSQISSALDFVLGILEQSPGHEETSRAIKNAMTLARQNELPHEQAIEQIWGDPVLRNETSRGWVAEEALAIGIYAALQGDDFPDVVAIAANHNGDSDSTASIAGQIYGAWKGAQSVPLYGETTTDVDSIVMSTAFIKGCL